MNKLDAKWKVYNEKGRYQLHKLNDDGTQGEAVGPAYEKREDALKYQRTLYRNSQDMKADTIEETESMNSTNLMSGRVQFQADEFNPRLLHFKDYVLARPESNKNKDRVDEQGIRELAATIAGMPVDYNHNPKQNVGVFTAGRVGAEGELRTDGLIWLDRCEENGVSAQEVLDGQFGMSVEADGDTAECSVCHGIFANESQYCEHIRVQGKDQGIRAKIKHGAERIMRGLRAMGGAFTHNPAGSGTGADALSGMRFAASHTELSMNDETSEVESVEKQEDMSPADDLRAESMNKEEAMDKKPEEETPEEDKKETPKDEKKEEEAAKMKAEYEATQKEMACLTAKLEEVTAEKADVESKLQSANAQLAEAQNTLKAHRVAELRTKFEAMAAEDFEANVDWYLSLNEKQLAQIIPVKAGNEDKPGRVRIAASEQQDVIVPSLF